MQKKKDKLPELNKAQFSNQTGNQHTLDSGEK